MMRRPPKSTLFPYAPLFRARRVLSSGRWASWRGRSRLTRAPRRSLEDVLDLLARLLGVGGALVDLTLGLEVLVAGRSADLLLSTPHGGLGRVLQLVGATHALLLPLGHPRSCRSEERRVGKACRSRGAP